MPIHPEFLADIGTPGTTEGVREGVREGVQALSETEARILRALKDGPRDTSELARDLGHRALNRNLRQALARLEDRGLVALTIPETPRSRFQKRQLTIQGHKVMRGGK